MNDRTEMVSSPPDPREIKYLVEDHGALATTFEIKGALGTIILQMDKTLQEV